VSPQITDKKGKRPIVLIVPHELALYVYLLACVFMDIELNTT
jgi:hypothetical protein